MTFIRKRSCPTPQVSWDEPHIQTHPPGLQNLPMSYILFIKFFDNMHNVGGWACSQGGNMTWAVGQSKIII